MTTEEGAKRNDARLDHLDSTFDAFKKQQDSLLKALKLIERSRAEDDPEAFQAALMRFFREDKEAVAAANEALMDSFVADDGEPGSARLSRLASEHFLQAGRRWVALDYPRAKLDIYARTRAELGRRRACEKEPWTVEWIERSLAEGGIFYDIGANVGAYSLIAAAVLGDRGRVYAFEPSYSNYAALIDNVALNGAERAIVAMPFGLSDQLGLVQFQYRSTVPGAALHHMGTDEPPEGAKKISPTLTYPILSYPLDRAVADFQLPAPTAIKIDVDGHECPLLRGARQTLSGPALRSVMIECSGDDGRADVRRILCDEIGLTPAGEWTNAPEAGSARVSYMLFERS